MADIVYAYPCTTTPTVEQCSVGAGARLSADAVAGMPAAPRRDPICALARRRQLLASLVTLLSTQMGPSTPLLAGVGQAPALLLDRSPAPGVARVSVARRLSCGSRTGDAGALRV